LLKFYDSSAKNNHIVKNKRKIDEITAEEFLSKDQKTKKRKNEKYTKILDNFKDTDTGDVIL